MPLNVNLDTTTGLKFQQPNIPPGRTAMEGLASGLGPMLQQVPSLMLQYQQLKQQRQINDKEHELKLKALDMRQKMMENPQQYGGYIMDSNGTPQFMPLPAGFKPANMPQAPAQNLIQPTDISGNPLGDPTILPAGKVTVTKPIQEKTPLQTVEEKATAKEIAKAKADLASTRPMVNGAVSEIERVIKLNDNSYGGFFGNLKRKAVSAMNSGENDEKFKNTTDVINTMQGQVVRVLKSSFGGQLSDGEREYLNGIYGALPKMSIEERKIAMTNVIKMLSDKLQGAESKYIELGGQPEQRKSTQVNDDPLGLFK